MSLELTKKYGLTVAEYKKIVEVMGRTPNHTELGIFSVMWSEHCSYKSSKVHLKRFPNKGKNVIQGPGENAGIIEFDRENALVFKIESHNHPSFIEPFQGAATGVGGILRDIFTMGARPIVNMNSLRFGSPSNPRTKYLLKRVVAGIANYGNCMGIPTVGGEVAFDDCYNGNILVNAFSLGIVKKGRIFKGIASGVDNLVMYVGSKTGRDGIHGATMASEEFDKDSEEKRPTVQVGDPFTEKLLLEACLEVMNTDYITGIQDMGAAGLTCSSVEMAGRGGSGIELELSLVPLREQGMTPYEIMLSESQERMLLIVRRGVERDVKEIFNKWELDAVVIGKVTDTGRLVIKEKGDIVADIPIKPLSEDTPVYKRPSKRPKYLDNLYSFNINQLPLPTEYGEVFLKILRDLSIASKRWVYEQYDYMVGMNTVIFPGSDAALVRVKGSNKAIAITLDCNSRYCYLDPYKGGVIVISEAARNISCCGAKPVAVTDCLNFGSPERPEIMWQFEKVIDGMCFALNHFELPVISGNVSFYNESDNTSIYPTPVIGMVGILDNIDNYCTQWFKREGDLIVLLGENTSEIGASQYLKIIHNITAGSPPSVDIKRERNVHNACIEAIQGSIINSAHDCSDGGLLISLAESCISNPDKVLFGIDVDIKGDMRTDVLLLNEAQSRIIVSLKNNNLERLKSIADRYKVPLTILGHVTKKGFNIAVNSTNIISMDIEAIYNHWDKALEGYIER